jgi:NADP-dependent 3-hydroxy acid dehydrogenase YdfG
LKKNILIIGGTSGIGYDISNKFTIEKNNVFVVGRKNLLPKIPKVNYFKFDLLKENHIQNFLKKINKISKIDLVIHCIGGSLGIKKLDYESCVKVWETNVGIPIRINNFLIKKKIVKQKSNIFLFSSKAANDLSEKAAYSMSKSFIETYVKNSSIIYQKKKIYFYCLKPGIVCATGNNWYKCKRDNLKKYDYFVKKINKRGLEINSNNIFNKIKTIIKSKKNKRIFDL